MRIRWLLVGSVAAAVVLGRVAPVRASTFVSVGVGIRTVEDFYEPLAPYGYWVEIASYGRCWRPAYVDQGWRPYCYGHWVWSDDGWYWMSDEPWAWATYHYGRWVWDAYYGWVWVPDVVWAPSWVCWREGGGYVGWAPLPPRYDYEPATEVVVVPPQYFIFVEHRHFCEPIRPSILVVNQTVIQKTVNITKIGKGSTVIINQGPRLEVIERNNPGRLVKVKLERRLPSEVQQARQQRGEAAAPTPEIIRGSRRNADAALVIRPSAPPSSVPREQPEPRRPQNRVRAETPVPVATETEPIAPRRQGKPASPVPPAPVVAQPRPQPLPPTAATPEQPDYGRGRKLGHHKGDDDFVPPGRQGR